MPHDLETQLHFDTQKDGVEAFRGPNGALFGRSTFQHSSSHQKGKPDGRFIIKNLAQHQPKVKLIEAPRKSLESTKHDVRPGLANCAAGCHRSCIDHCKAEKAEPKASVPEGPGFKMPTANLVAEEQGWFERENPTKANVRPMYTKSDKEPKASVPEGPGFKMPKANLTTDAGWFERENPTKAKVPPKSTKSDMKSKASAPEGSGFKMPTANLVAEEGGWFEKEWLDKRRSSAKVAPKSTKSARQPFTADEQSQIINLETAQRLGWTDDGLKGYQYGDDPSGLANPDPGEIVA